jgi:ADP-heptose:LPS heptosyltransferase
MKRGPGIGDILTLTPSIREIRRQFPQGQVHVATNLQHLNGALASVLLHNPDVTSVIDIHRPAITTPDLVLDLDRACISHESKIGNSPRTRIDLFADYVGIELRDHTLRYFIEEQELSNGYDLLNGHKDKETLLVQLGTSGNQRSIPPTLAIPVLRALAGAGIQCIVLSHPSERSTEVLPREQLMTLGIVFWDNLPLRTIAGVMPFVSGLLCPDSSLLHLAAAIGLPTIGLFGPTSPQSRLSYYPKAIGLWAGSHNKRCPCFSSTCSLRYRCWMALDPNVVVKTTIDHLQVSEPVDILRLSRSGAPTIQTEVI